MSIVLRMQVLLALMFTWAVIPDAAAQTLDCKLSNAECSVAQAQAQCEAFVPTNASIPGGVTRRECVREGSATSGRFFLRYWGKNSSGAEVGAFINGYWYWRNKCAQEEQYIGQGPWHSGGMYPRNGSVGCRNGCDGAWYNFDAGVQTWVPSGLICPDDQKQQCQQKPGWYWNPVLNICEPPQGECPDGLTLNSLGQCAPEPCPEGMISQADGTCKKKENECPAGQVRSPDGKCLPGDGQCAKGEARGKDGTCKRDKDEDGNPDEGEEPDPDSGEAFSGGDDCSSPPSCSGSPILCGQARIQWRIDCNTRKNRNIAGGVCGSPPICTGDKCDALEYSGLIMQWRTACAVEKLAQGNGGNGTNGDLAAIKDALTGTNGSANPGESLPGSGAWLGGGSGSDPIEPDTSGYGWGGGSCPALPAIDVMGATIQFDPTPLCNWLSLGSYFVMGLAALASLRIVATKDA